MVLLSYREITGCTGRWFRVEVKRSKIRTGTEHSNVLTLCFSKRSLLRPADMSTRRASECALKCALRLLRREDATLGLSFTAHAQNTKWGRARVAQQASVTIFEVLLQQVDAIIRHGSRYRENAQRAANTQFTKYKCSGKRHNRGSYSSDAPRLKLNTGLTATLNLLKPRVSEYSSTFAHVRTGFGQQKYTRGAIRQHLDLLPASRTPRTSEHSKQVQSTVPAGT